MQAYDTSFLLRAKMLKTKILLLSKNCFCHKKMYQNSLKIYNLTVAIRTLISSQLVAPQGLPRHSCYLRKRKKIMPISSRRRHFRLKKCKNSNRKVFPQEKLVFFTSSYDFLANIWVFRKNA